MAAFGSHSRALAVRN